jgi:hypothetical protein
MRAGIDGAAISEVKNGFNNMEEREKYIAVPNN